MNPPPTKTSGSALCNNLASVGLALCLCSTTRPPNCLVVPPLSPSLAPLWHHTYRVGWSSAALAGWAVQLFTRSQCRLCPSLMNMKKPTTPKETTQDYQTTQKMVLPTALHIWLQLRWNSGKENTKLN